MTFFLQSLFWTLFYFALNIFFLKNPLTLFTPINLTISFSYFYVLSLIYNELKTKWARGITSIFYILPMTQIFYFNNFRELLNRQILSLVLKEHGFMLELILSMLKIEILVMVLGLFLFSFITNQIFSKKNGKIDIFILFKKWPFIALLLIAEAIQISWCIRRGMSAIIGRTAVPLFFLFSISLLYSLIKSKYYFRALAVIFTLSLNVAVSTTLLNGYKDKFLFDSQFYQLSFSSVLMSNNIKKLSMSSEGMELHQKTKTPLMDYNVLIILNDALRLDSLSAEDPSKTADLKLKWFYEKSHNFKYPISPSNMTDSSIPSIFTGISTGNNIMEFKDNLRIWDFYSKTAKTFYIQTAELEWANLDKFIKSPGMEHAWSVYNESYSKSEIMEKGDELSKNYLVSYLNKTSEPFFGIWHTDSTHSYYGFPVSKNFQIFEKTEQMSDGEKRRVDYDNAINFLSHQIDDALKKIDLEKTIVIFTSDHGEAFGEHGFFYHGTDFHQESIRIPMIWYIPPKIWKKIPKSNQENFLNNKNKVTSSLDITPSLLELHQLITGQNLNFYPHPFSGESLFKDHKNDRIVTSSQCIQLYRCFNFKTLFASNKFSLIFDPEKGIIGFYDTLDDPEQKKVLNPKEYLSNKDFKTFINNTIKSHNMGKVLNRFLYLN